MLVFPDHESTQCSNQFAKNVSPRSNQSVGGVPPSVNQLVTSQTCELTNTKLHSTKNNNYYVHLMYS